MLWQAFKDCFKGLSRTYTYSLVFSVYKVNDYEHDQTCSSVGHRIGTGAVSYRLSKVQAPAYPVIFLVFVHSRILSKRSTLMRQ